LRASAVPIALLTAALLVIACGFYVESRPVPPRAQDQTAAASAAWYASLPERPDAATAAYLSRIPADMRDKGERYGNTRLLALALQFINLIAATALLCLARFGVRLRAVAGRVSGRAAVVDALVALGYFLALFVLTLPAELYAGFARPRLYGFSDQGFAGWLGDTATNAGIFTVFYAVGVVAVYRIIRSSPARWMLWSVGVYFVLRAGYALLTPGLIEPLTNDFRPLPEGAQKQQIVALAQAAHVGNAEIVTGNASRQTRIPNAHVSGIGNRARISVDDNALDASSGAMLRALVGHELGHYVLHHMELFVLTDTALMFAGFAFVGAAMGFALRRWHRQLGVSGMGDIAGLPVFWGAFLLWGFLSLPVTNAINRAVEHQADLYSLELAHEPHGLAEFMIHTADNARLSPGPLEYALLYTHPSDAERVRTAMEWRAAHEHDR